MPETNACMICGGMHWTDAEDGGQCINCGHTHPNMTLDADLLGDYEVHFRQAIRTASPVDEARIDCILEALWPVLDAYRWDIAGAKEAAAILGVSKSRFHELKARGDLPGGKQLADKVVYRGEDIRACAAQRKTPQ